MFILKLVQVANNMFKDYNKTIFILIGIQASGKTSFCQEYFRDIDTVSLDVINNRKNEDKVISELINTGKRFVIDNTNPTKAERKKYIDIAKQNGYKTVGIYFRSSVDECAERNAKRETVIPLKGILSTAKKLEQPSYSEGFNDLFYVKIDGNGFKISKWNEEL